MPVYGPDPVWTGVGNKSAWLGVSERKFYRIAWLLGSLSTDDAILDMQPHPNEFVPGRLVGAGGDGRPIRLGFPTAVWHFTQMSAGQMQQLFYARDQANALNAGTVYITTSTDNVESNLNLVTGFDEMRFTYRNFSAKILDITYTHSGSYVFKDVVVKFGHLQSV